VGLKATSISYDQGNLSPGQTTADSVMALALLWTPAASAQLSCSGGVSGKRVAHLAVRPAQLAQDAFEDVTIAMRNNKLPPRLGEQSTRNGSKALYWRQILMAP